MSHHALTLLARDLDAQHAGMSPADCAILASQLRLYAAKWARESRALDEVVENAREEALQAELDGPEPLMPQPTLHPVRLSADLMAVRRDVLGELDAVIAAQVREVRQARAQRGEAG